MNDETYSFIEDLREKKQIARSAHNRRTHCGRSGAIRFGYENMTKKEIEAMSSETKTYNLELPMAWKEFKRMPADLQAAYIKGLWNKFDIPVKNIAAMMGCGYSTLANRIAALGLSTPNRGYHTWDEDGFRKWCGGDVNETAVQAVPDPAPDHDLTAMRQPFAPDCGELHFCGNANKILQTVFAVLGDANVNMTVSWEIMDEVVVEENG